MSFLRVEDAISGLSYVAKIAADATPTILEHVPTVAYHVFRSYVFYSMYESALANILCVKTFRHGTDPYAFVRIHLEGNDPSRGGTGGEARWFQTTQGTISPYSTRDQGHFFVVEDVIGSENHGRGFLNFTARYYSTKLTLKYYAMRSNFSFFGSWLPLPRFIKGPITKGLVAFAESDIRARLALGALCPSVKFHLNPSKVTVGAVLEKERPVFARDGISSQEKGNFEGALATKYEFSILDIGILGVIKSGVNTGIVERIRQNRGQFLLGLVQLVAAVGLTVFFFPATFLSDSVVANITFSAKLLEDFTASGLIAGYVGEFAQAIFYGPLAAVFCMCSIEM